MNILLLKQGINKKIIQPIVMQKRRKKFRNKEYSIISVNCIGGGISHDFGWKFLSPTINLFMLPKDFLMFCENLEECVKLPVKYKETGYSGKEYPIGKIEFSKGEIDIHFLHYDSFDKAKQKWYERCKRVDMNRIVVLFSDQNGCTTEDIERFYQLNYPKLLFVGTKANAEKFKNSIYVKPNKYEIENNINPVDKCMIFSGLTGKRRYEKGFDIESFFQELEN